MNSLTFGRPIVRLFFPLEASEFLCTKTLHLEGVEQPKISPKKLENASSDALLISRFQNFAATPQQKNLQTALRAILKN